MKSKKLCFLMAVVCVLLTNGLLNFHQAAFGQAVAVSAASPPVDLGWPKVHQKDGQTVVIFQPQVDEWKDHEKIEFRAATAVTPLGATEPVYGVISARADTIVDPDSRTVYFTNIQMDARFTGQDEAKTRSLQLAVQDVMGGDTVVPVALERVLACIKPQKAAGVQVNLDPPQIYYSDSPAVLVMFTSAPIFKPIPGLQLEFAVNTNWDVFRDPVTLQYYLLNGDSWLTTPDLMKGPWTAANPLPSDLYNLPPGADWDDVRKNVPGKPATSIPKVIVNTAPAELINTDGAPKLAAIPGTTLQDVTNPDMPLFYDTADSNYYYLVAGRWFRTNNLSGDWSAASAQLPDEFAKIPSNSNVGYVLASVPGTDQAKDAILLAAIPHKATINVNDAKVVVAYSGAPQFVPIQGTAMTYAVNTSNQVIFANGMYYCCYQGVWFVSAAPTTAWVVCTSVPQVIYTIPPTCPVYNCTYVQVYSATPTTVVVGYTSGYSGEYVSATGALMFGAGMIAGAVIANNSDHYYPYPAPYYSYGCAAHYSYAYGGYYTGAAHYGPYGGASYSASYNSATGTYSRSASAYGAYGSASVHQAYNPYTNTAASHASGSNGYESWGTSAVSHNGNYAMAGHQTYANGSSSGAVESSSGKGGQAYQTAGGATVAKTNNGNVYAADNGKTASSNGNGQFNTNDAKNGSGQSYSGKNGSAYQTAGGADVAKSNNGDVYAGKDGNVYQKSDSGQWQQHTSSGWQDADKNTSSQMESEASSRSRGNEEADRSSSFRSGGGWGGGGAGFGGGGGFRGGGGRR